MTSTLSPYDTGDIRLGDRTRDLTYLLRPPVRRPEAEATRTGEWPLYEPQTFAVVDGAAELARLSAGETLVLPVGVTPAEQPPAEQTRPPRYRGRRRMVEPLDPRWAWVSIGFGGMAVLEAVVLLVALAVTR